MTDVPMRALRQAEAEDWLVIKALLVESALPVEDLGPDQLDGFLIAEEGSDVIGLIGLQIHGDIGLLRSLAVATAARHAGVGGKLVEALESASKAAGMTELWLLTIDAERFFERHGFQMMARESAPPGIQQTSEFSDLCPDTAFLMQKCLS